jgi:hypothetical protein
LAEEFGTCLFGTRYVPLLCASLMVIYLIIDIITLILPYRCKADIRKGTGSIGVQQVKE